MPASVRDDARGAPRAAAGNGPFILDYAGTSPSFSGPPEFAAADAAVLGRATLGRNAILGTASVIRADGHIVRAGDYFVLGRRSTVHIAHDIHPAIIGNRVAVGENAVIHACTVGDDVVVGDNAVILDGSVVADGVVLEPGAIVFPRAVLDAGKVCSGMPARPIRDVAPGEIAGRRADIVTAARADDGRMERARDSGVASLVAATANLSGTVRLAAGASIWFGCTLDASDAEIEVGENTNIQDNTVIRCRPGHSFSIGADSTIGHNVTLADCTIGARSLIGIGSVVAPGTVIGDDVFLAGGAETLPGQILDSGSLWGRRPAVRMADLDAGKRDLIALTVHHYRHYAKTFAAAQRAAVRT